MTNSATELLLLEHGIDYSPTFINTDNRLLNSSSLGYYQIGVNQQYGFANGPIFKIEFVDISSISGLQYIKIWGIKNDDNNAPMYPISYLLNIPIIEVYLKKFIFLDSSLNEINPSANSYTIVGHKKSNMPYNF